MISHVEFTPPPRKTSATAVVGGGDGRSALARRLITLVDKKNLKYLSRKIITIVMVYIYIKRKRIFIYLHSQEKLKIILL